MLTSTITKRLVGALASLALALGLASLGTAPATAAGTVWDRVASCESGGNWSINTGNGYYGGLQFSSSTWRGFGGGAYASSANRATKSQQIAIARRVLATQGPGAWPTCGPRAGLTRSNGGANSSATSGSTSVRTRPTTQRPSAYTQPSSSKTVRVRSGDTLSRIANRNGVRGGWRVLWSLNKRTVKNPNWIYIGQVLRVR
jgi:LysM repeat protein